MADENTTDTTDTAAADDSHHNPIPAADRVFGEPDTGGPDGDGSEEAKTSGETTGDGGGDLRFPEGVNVDQQVLDDFKATTSELGLSTEQSQRLVDLQSQLIARQQEAFADTLKGWTESVKGDREIGGQAFDENVATARRALSRFGSPQLRDVLTSTGMGNHPELVRAFVRIGKAMGDGRFVSAGQQAGKRDPADILFGDNND